LQSPRERDDIHRAGIPVYIDEILSRRVVCWVDLAAVLPGLLGFDRPAGVTLFLELSNRR
jgi:hypothetical protein